MDLQRKQNIIAALSKYLSIDVKNVGEDIEKSDLKSLVLTILKSSPSSSSFQNDDEVTKWIAFAESFPADPAACDGAIAGLNDELLHKSVLVGGGFTVSESDVIVYTVIHPSMIAMSQSVREAKFINVLRWMDYVQSNVDFGDVAQKIPLEKAKFEPPASTSVAAAEINTNPKGATKDVKADTNAKKDAAKGSKTAEPEAVKAVQKDTSAKGKSDKPATDTKPKKPATEAASKDDVSVSLLNIQVGLIRKAWKHPSADSLLVEEIDIGESKVRQVVSGLAKYLRPDDLVNRRVALITNVKPGKLRDVVSEGLVLCASSEDHSVVEPLLPPEAAQVGERISFPGHEGKPEDVLNPKKKQLDKITPYLFTDENGVATFKGVPFMTSAGPCTSSIRKGTIK